MTDSIETSEREAIEPESVPTAHLEAQPEPVAQIEDDAKAMLQSLGEKHGYGWCQYRLGEMWEEKHDCAPRGQMGVTAKDDPLLVPGLMATIQELREKLNEEQETVWQLNRALREATEGPTFMGEPVLAAAPTQPAPQPLTDERIGELAQKAFRDYMEDRNDDHDIAFARAVIAEFCRLNGITAQKAGAS